MELRVEGKWQPSVQQASKRTEMALWFSWSRWMLPHSVRMTTASTAAFASAYALGVPEGISATVTAMVVTQSNLGGSLRTASEQIIGSMLGAIYAIAVALAIRLGHALSLLAALIVALAPLSMLAAHSPGFRVAPVTAAIVLLGGAGLQLSPLDLAFERIVGIGLGTGVGLLVSVLVLPARASQSVIDTADRILGFMAEQLEALAAGGTTCREVRVMSSEIRDSLVRLASFVEDASHERRARLAGVPDGQRLLRTLRRVRHDVTVRRAKAAKTPFTNVPQHPGSLPPRAPPPPSAPCARFSPEGICRKTSTRSRRRPGTTGVPSRTCVGRA